MTLLKTVIGWLSKKVYQSCVYGDDTEFYSYKKVLSEMDSTISSTVELASFNTASKGFMGECGLRGGYVELVNLCPAVMKHAHMLFSTRKCPPVVGQIALDLMADPPKPGDPSFPTFSEKRQMEPDMLYCLHLLEETGLHVRPGCKYGQRKDSHHIRLFVGTQENIMEDALQRLKTFHMRFMKEFS
ncbi:alanine aminotransferase 2-like protein [Labeo rohita]|uniref:Alanine aminotransferase 2-like protein n=1 Tax=Labeo rohita TaxID=84645 RepID=A0A498LGH9_LABRO|nr:alanine aminotransferase 2-like protein [Labeo rohita]